MFLIAACSSKPHLCIIIDHTITLAYNMSLNLHAARPETTQPGWHEYVQIWHIQTRCDFRQRYAVMDEKLNQQKWRLTLTYVEATS